MEYGTPWGRGPGACLLVVHFGGPVVFREVLAWTEIPGGGDGREELCLMLCWHHRNDFGIKMGSSVSHFNVLLIARGEVRTHCV